VYTRIYFIYLVSRTIVSFELFSSSNPHLTPNPVTFENLRYTNSVSFYHSLLTIRNFVTQFSKKLNKILPLENTGIRERII
jgi:hypothetical protein